MRKKVIFGILGIFFIVFTISSFSRSTASVQQTVLSDNSPLYTTTDSNDEAFYITNVQPGNYTVVGVRSAVDAGTAALYTDLGYTQKISDVVIQYDSDEINWDEVGFFTVDGTGLTIETPYYLKAYNFIDYHYVEMENGMGTGMVDLDVNDTASGSFVGNEILDAYQVYLEVGNTYYISLDVPTGKTFDLFLCYGISNEESSLGYSHVDSLSADESITRSISVSGYYCIVVTNPAFTTGDYTLSIKALADDNPVYSSSYHGDEVTYAVPVQPGNYSVMGIRSAVDAGNFDLYTDVGYIDKISDVTIQFDSDEIKWDEVGFFTIDGTGFASETSYYLHARNFINYHYVEMENGMGTGMVDLDVNDTVSGSFSEDEIFDAYQVYLEVGNTYHIFLDVPLAKTFDLFLCYGISNEESSLGYSHVDTLGADESITRSVSVSGYYCIVITNPDFTSGDYTLSIKELQDDEPVHASSYLNYEVTYAVPVQPGNYSVMGIRTAVDAGNFDLYTDAGYTDKISDVVIQFDSDEIKWDEVGFFTIDGTGFSSETSYYLHARNFNNYLYVEMENGMGTGMVDLDVNDSKSGSFSENEIFDAYQVYLEVGIYYNIVLDVAADKSFDLFLCYGISNEEDASASSHSNDLGVDETIDSYSPTATGYYCIVVTNPDETSGSYTLSIQGSAVAPTTETTTTTIGTEPATTTTTPAATTSEPTTSGAAHFSGIVSVLIPFILAVVVIRKQRRH